MLNNKAIDRVFTEASHNWHKDEVFHMAMRSNFMADLAQMVNGAASAFGGMREEIDNMIRQRMERSLNARGLVTREEFDALRTRHEAVAARLAALEAKMPTKADSPATTSVRRKTAKAATSRTKKATK
jgi:BMFP domain-containing protein YqiC